jgi:hypothetical protein
MGASAKVTTNAPANPDNRVMMFLLLSSLRAVVKPLDRAPPMSVMNSRRLS